MVVSVRNRGDLIRDRAGVSSNVDGFEIESLRVGAHGCERVQEPCFVLNRWCRMGTCSTTG